MQEPRNITTKTDCWIKLPKMIRKNNISKTTNLTKTWNSREKCKMPWNMKMPN